MKSYFFPVFLFLAIFITMPPKAGAQTDKLRIGTPMTIKIVNLLKDYHYNILAMLMTHDTLVRFDSKLCPVPQLAESWTCSKDGKTWEFTMVSNAKWHDEKPVTAEDVKFTFEYLGSHQPSCAWIPDLIDKININEQKIRFTLKKPYSRFLFNSGFIIRILPEHIWSKIDDPLKTSCRDVVIGCGPYLFEGYDQKKGTIKFKKNTRYYQEIPETGQIEFILNQNMDLLTLSLLKNKVDVYYKYASGYPAPYLTRLSKDHNIGFAQEESMGIPAALGFNLENIFLGKKEFRKAVSLAINYQRINNSLFKGKGRIPTSGFVPSIFSSYKKMPDLKYNPGQCEAILISLGLKDRDNDGIREDQDGNKISFTLVVRSDLWGDAQLVKLLTHDLKKVGLHVNVRMTDLSTWITSVRSKAFDLVLFRTTPWGMIMASGYASGYFDSRRQGGGVLANITDPLFHDLCDNILSMTDLQTVKNYYYRLQEYYAAHLPAIALCWNKNVYPYRKNWTGISVNQIEGGLINRFTLNSLKNINQ
ncbi:ABC transporter substrate-binding protein [Desulfobacula sp.]|uniref:ABC transporter substrate-binding protein n=1 Tax=Desulfobacula sp. TaxID=2593537 RepID=UPI0025BC7AED|nr:ABC transporter substrate-binding protein [Desulfobacula sp.]MBC2705747.1 ABC transporter substrate-binding protein [Desulfobacula sp.]